MEKAKKYKLLKDLPGTKAGETTDQVEDTIYGLTAVFHSGIYRNCVYLTDKEWIEEIIPEEKEFTRKDVRRIMYSFSNLCFQDFQTQEKYKGIKGMNLFIDDLLSGKYKYFYDLEREKTESSQPFYNNKFEGLEEDYDQNQLDEKL